MSEDVHMNSYTYINLYIRQHLTVVVVHGADKKTELCLILLDYLDMQNKKRKRKCAQGPVTELFLLYASLSYYHYWDVVGK